MTTYFDINLDLTAEDKAIWDEAHHDVMRQASEVGYHNMHPIHVISIST
jgi:hypothetical protein